MLLMLAVCSLKKSSSRDEHERIIDDHTFEQVQERLHRNGSKGERKVRNKYGALLKGLVQCGSCGGAMIHTYVQKKKARYRYYVCAIAHQRGWNKCETRSVSAPELEGAVSQPAPQHRSRSSRSF